MSIGVSPLFMRHGRAKTGHTSDTTICAIMTFSSMCIGRKEDDILMEE
jgi:hypothetical protein